MKLIKKSKNKSVIQTSVKNVNNMINKFLLADDTFMPEINLKQSRFTFIDCGPFTRNTENIEKIKETTGCYCVYIYIE